MLLATLLVLLGLAASVAAVQLLDLRLSGVVAVPLASVYVCYEFAMLPILLASVAVAYAAIVLLRRRTFLFGRQLLVAGIVAGAAIPIVTIRALETLGPTGPLSVAFVGSILPGIAAYNYARLDPGERLRDAVASLAALAGLLAIGVSLVRPATVDVLGTAAPPILFAEGSDVAALRDVAVHAADDGLAPHDWTTVALVAGIALHEAVYTRWGVRLTGMVALPLVALFSLSDPIVLALYAGGVLGVFAGVEALSRRTLLYGRVLLACGIAAGVALAAVAGLGGAPLPGFVLLFVGLFAGIGGYNVHRTAAPERPAALGVSAAVLAGAVAGFHVLGLGPERALSTTAIAAVAAVLLVGLAFAFDLERARRGVPRGVIGA